MTYTKPRDEDKTSDIVCTAVASVIAGLLVALTVMLAWNYEVSTMLFHAPRISFYQALALAALAWAFGASLPYKR